MEKLKVGDRVKVITTYAGDPRIGQTATISKLFNNGRVHVKLDIGEYNYSMFIGGLKLLEKPTTESQNKQILKYLQSGATINPLTALDLFGSFRFDCKD